MKNLSNVHVIIPSRGRSETIETHKLLYGLPFGSFSVLVQDDELDAYTEALREYENITIVSCGKVRGITNKRNFILDQYPENTFLLMVDDDIRDICRLSVDGKGLEPLSQAMVGILIKRGFNLMVANRTRLWGLHPVPNAFYMSPTVSPNKFVIGSFMGVWTSDIRCDPELPLKQDYDLTIKHVLRFKKIVRFDGFCVRARHYTNPGGVSDYRSEASEEAAVKRLMELYPDYVKRNPKRSGQILLTFRQKKEKKNG